MRLNSAEAGLVNQYGAYLQTTFDEDFTMVTQARLKELLHYNPDTGIFTRLTSISQCESGDISGSRNRAGYVQISIDTQIYRAHRLAFLYMTGSFPKNQTDHINGIRHDNRWLNLRDVTPTENLRNQKMRVNNRSGFMGVCWNKANSKWVSRIKLDGKYKYLGVFDDLSDAVAARAEANIKYGFHANHGKR